MRTIPKRTLYLITGRQYRPDRDMVDLAREALRSGIDILQMREKDLSREAQKDLARQLCRLCRKEDKIFIVNDDPVLAREVDADGVHLGQEDIRTFSVEDTRRLLGNDKIIGVSTHNLEQVRKANAGPLDYIGFGPLFPTLTKDYTIGTADLEAALALSRVPVICIGGITAANAPGLIQRGAQNIAVIRDIIQAPDIEKKVRQFRKLLERVENANKN